MNRKKVAVAALITAAWLTSPAHAGVFSFGFHGAGVSGSIDLTYAPDPNTGPLGTSPNLFDPVGANIITGISGTFSDANIGIHNAAITGLVPANPAHPDATNLLAPASFGFYLIKDGVPNPGGTAPGFSYDDLFYPAGSPQTA